MFFPSRTACGLKGCWLLQGCCGRRPGGCRALFTVVVRGWCLSLLAAPSVWFVVSPFPLWWPTTFSIGLRLCLLAIPLLTWVVLPSFVVAPGSPPTCMSEEAVSRLTLAINRLAAAIENKADTGPVLPLFVPSSSSSAPELRVLYPPTIPFPLEVWTPFCQELRFYAVETGPPEVPDFCLSLGRQKLVGSSALIEKKVSSAFIAGFWARVSLDCVVPYSQRKSEAPGESISHFVVLRSSHSSPFRVTFWQDLTDLCDITDPTIVYEIFATFTEVQIFCAGAGTEIPALKRWIKET